jgi:hypothetical protein
LFEARVIFFGQTSKLNDPVQIPNMVCHVKQFAGWELETLLAVSFV